MMPSRSPRTRSSVDRSDMLRPDPIFPGLKNNLVQDGRYRSDALQVKIEQRVLGGQTSGILTWGISYTLSKAFEANHRLNDWNSGEPLIHELANNNKPHTFAFPGLQNFPFAQDRS